MNKHCKTGIHCRNCLGNAEVMRVLGATKCEGPFHPTLITSQHESTRVDGHTNYINPGTALHKLIKACGFKPKSGCGCALFASQMDQWGWIGCATTHRQEIVDWLIKKAEESGVVLQSNSVTGLVIAACREFVKQSIKL